MKGSEPSLVKAIRLLRTHRTKLLSTTCCQARVVWVNVAKLFLNVCSPSDQTSNLLSHNENTCKFSRSWFSPAGVHYHNEFVPLRAVSDSQLDLTQGVLAGGRATRNTQVSQCPIQTLRLNLYSTREHKNKDG